MGAHATCCSHGEAIASSSAYCSSSSNAAALSRINHQSKGTGYRSCSEAAAGRGEHVDLTVAARVAAGVAARRGDGEEGTGQARV
jgi:hypothetical protein